MSFETIEHLREQEAMLAEFRRVLAPGGVLVISSPNRPVYNEGGGVENHFHVRELDRAELAALLAPAFPQQSWYAQRVVAQSALWAEGAVGGRRASSARWPATACAQANAPAPPMYFVVVCAAAGVALPALPALSLFDDGALSLWRDYARALVRERELAWDEIDARSDRRGPPGGARRRPSMRWRARAKSAACRRSASQRSRRRWRRRRTRARQALAACRRAGP